MSSYIIGITGGVASGKSEVTRRFEAFGIAVADEDLAGVARYIVANPLRAKLVRALADYPFWDAVWL